MKEDWKELSDDEFIDASDREIFEWYLSDPSAVLMEMANVVGNKVTLEHRLPFSFHFSSRKAVHNRHGIRLKVIWNPNKAPEDADGYFEMHGDYEYTRASKKYKPSADELRIARNFIKKYKVLFAAVWEDILDPDPLQDYFKGRIDLRELLTNFDLRGINYYKVNHCKTLQELEDCVCKNKIFNMND
mgnify:CR=1 FL=1